MTQSNAEVELTNQKANVFEENPLYAGQGNSTNSSVQLGHTKKEISYSVPNKPKEGSKQKVAVYCVPQKDKKEVTMEENILYESTSNRKDKQNPEPVYTVPDKKDKVIMEDNILYESTNNRIDKQKPEPVYMVPDKKNKVTMEDNILYEITYDRPQK